MISKIAREFFATQQANPTHWTHDSVLLARATKAADAAFAAASEEMAPIAYSTDDQSGWDAAKLAKVRHAADIAYFDVIRAAGWDVRDSPR
jgi:hypothetical protein